MRSLLIANLGERVSVTCEYCVAVFETATRARKVCCLRCSVALVFCVELESPEIRSARYASASDGVRDRKKCWLSIIIAASALLLRPTPARVPPIRCSAVGPLPTNLDGGLPALVGPVAEGFGRGSKKLGIPTANLPCSLFQDALADLPCGVYVGWAALRGDVHKCVCNIGFSPTFAGEENPEKIVEAHVMSEFDSDFYGERMGLLLLGFIRPSANSTASTSCSRRSKATLPPRRRSSRAPLSEAASTPWLLEVAGGGGGDGATFQLLAPDEVADEGPPECIEVPSGSFAGSPPEGFDWGGLY